jgi:hypothetical protein|nr:MAG TPA: hypothetical protein [Caudoviricetes sp.]
MRMAKAEKDVFSVYESVKATPFGVAFLLAQIASIEKQTPRRVKNAILL